MMPYIANDGQSRAMVDNGKTIITSRPRLSSAQYIFTQTSKSQHTMAIIIV